MKGTLAAVAALAALTGCALSAGSERVAGNPHHACRDAGLTPGTEAYARCLDTLVAERCGSDVDARCADDLRQAAFLARQLELDGYRLFGQSS